MPFHDRQDELAFLAAQARDDRAALVVLYGRRRTGKTSLLRQFARDRASVLFVADQSSRADQLAAFSAAVFQGLGEAGLEGTTFPTWEAALRFLGGRAREKPLLVALDEFSHLCDADPSLPSVLQRLWDAELQESRLHLVLCGSYVSFMEREVLAAKNPLYGRRTGDWLLEPFGVVESGLFHPDLPPDARIQVYGILGGMPAWLERWDPSRPVEENLFDLILRKGAPLRDEPRFLLMEELRDPRVYFSLCRAVACGATSPNEIAQAAGLPDRGATSRYLETLRNLRVLERSVPVTERSPERTRRGHYRLADPLFRFWFRFVLPNTSALEAGDPEGVLRTRVLPHLDQHVAPAFEDAARQHLWRLVRARRAPAAYDRVGAWWRAGAEVDVVAVTESDQALLLGEVKWSRNPLGLDVLERLVARTDAVAADLERPPREVRYALWTRSGFTPDLERRARAEKVLLFTPEDVLETGKPLPS